MELVINEELFLNVQDLIHLLRICKQRDMKDELS